MREAQHQPSEGRQGDVAAHVSFPEVRREVAARTRRVRRRPARALRPRRGTPGGRVAARRAGGARPGGLASRTPFGSPISSSLWHPDANRASSSSRAARPDSRDAGSATSSMRGAVVRRRCTAKIRGTRRSDPSSSSQLSTRAFSSLTTGSPCRCTTKGGCAWKPRRRWMTSDGAAVSWRAAVVTWSGCPRARAAPRARGTSCGSSRRAGRRTAGRPACGCAGGRPAQGPRIPWAAPVPDGSRTRLGR